MVQEPGEQTPKAGKHFATTQWTLVLAARDAALGAAKALAALCQAYWLPLYTYVRRRGYQANDAEDLTQGLFQKLLSGGFAGVERERGRFRAYLLGALQHHLADERDRSKAQRRGGGATVISLDAQTAETRYQFDAPADEATPERAFARQWAVALLDAVLTRLRDEQAALGKAATFDALAGLLTAEESGYAPAASKLGISEPAARVTVHRMRQRYRVILREEIRRTVDTDDAVEPEIGYLFEMLGK